MVIFNFILLFCLDDPLKTFVFNAGNNGGVRRFSSPIIGGSSSNTSHHFPPLRQLTVGERVSQDRSQSPASVSKIRSSSLAPLRANVNLQIHQLTQTRPEESQRGT